MRLSRARFFVMQGASHRDELVYDTELMTLSTRHPDLVQFVSSVSRPSAERNAGWTGRTGRINLLIEEDPGPMGFAEARYAHLLVR